MEASCSDEMKVMSPSSEEMKVMSLSIQLMCTKYYTTAQSCGMGEGTV